MGGVRRLGGVEKFGEEGRLGGVGSVSGGRRLGEVGKLGGGEVGLSGEVG